MRITIAVASGKGGVGKSTVALNLACALAQEGLRTGLLDADIYGPDIPRMVNLTRTHRASHITLVTSPADGPQTIEPVQAYGIQIMSMGLMVAEDQPLDWSSPLVHLLVRRFVSDVDWGELDFLIVDLPPGTADLQQEITKQMRPDSVILVVTPQDVAHLDAKKVIEMCHRQRIDVIGGVQNMGALTCPQCASHIVLFPDVRPERSIWAGGIERLGTIPLDPVVAHTGEEGRPVIHSHPTSATATAFLELTHRVLAKTLA